MAILSSDLHSSLFSLGFILKRFCCLCATASIVDGMDILLHVGKSEVISTSQYKLLRGNVLDYDWMS